MIAQIQGREGLKTDRLLAGRFPQAQARATRGPSRNSILDALSDNVWEVVRGNLSRTLIHAGQVLQDRHLPVEYVYFVTHGLVSIGLESKSNSLIETGLIGSEGVVNCPISHCSQKPFYVATVVMAGHAFRLPAAEYHRYSRTEALFDLLQEYNLLQLAQAAQNVVCSRIHTIDQKVCRWLLAAADLTHSQTLEITHERLAGLLGVHRPGVSLILGELQRLRLLDSGRGTTTIVNGSALEKRSCDCYRENRARLSAFRQKCGH